MQPAIPRLQTASSAETEPIPLTRPLFGPEEEAAVAEVLRSGWVTQGPKVAEFERVVAHYVGAGEAVAVSSCTTALHLALVASGVGPGDEVICPSHTFIATANAIRYCGATPVMVDILPETFTLDPARVDEAVSKRTKAILPVHQGVPADLAEIQEIASRRGLLVIEDAAPALGCEYRGRKIGGSGNLACFSFHPRKILTTGEGGMITCDDSTLAGRLRRLRHHGMSVSDLDRHAARGPVFEEYSEVGFNYRMTDLQAAIGLVQMTRLDGILAERRRLAIRYRQALAKDVPWLQTPDCPPDRTHSYQSFITRMRPEAPVSRDEVIRALGESGIAAKRGIMNCHQEPAYMEGCRHGPLPHSEAALAECLILPLFPGMTDAQVERVVKAIASIVS